MTDGSGGFLSFGLGERAPEYRVLLALVAIQGFAWFLVFPLMPLYARSMGADGATIGFLMAFPAVFGVLLCIPGGMLVRRVGERGVFVLSFAFGIAASVTYFFATDVPWLFAGQMFFGASHAVFWPALTSYLGELGGTLRTGGGKLISFALGLNAVSYLAGPPLAGFLMDGIGSVYIFVIYAAVCLLGMERLRILAPGDETGTDGGEDQPVGRATTSGALELFGMPTFRFAVFGTWFSFASWGVLDTLFPLHVTDLGYGASALGLMLTLRSLVIVLCRFSAARLGEVIGFRTVSAVGLAILAASLLTISLTSSPAILVVASALAGAGPGFLPVANITLLAGALSRGRRPLGMAVNELSVGTGRLVGSSSAGVAGAALGFATTLGVAGGVVVGAAAILAVAASGRRPPGLLRRAGRGVRGAR